jgi:hypothetical protein
LTNLKVDHRSITLRQTLETVLMAILGTYRIIQAHPNRPCRHSPSIVRPQSLEMVWMVIRLMKKMTIIKSILLSITQNTRLSILQSKTQNY